MAYACPVSSRTSRAGSLLSLIPALLLSLAACSHSTEPSASKASAPPTDNVAPADSAAPSDNAGPADSAAATANLQPPSFLRYPGQAGAIEPWVQQQVELADAAHLRVLVYVGASWCEPCQHFHQAVEHGELNGTLNGLRFLEFDQDRDASALKVAGYLYQYIPVLALPDPDGRNHGRMISGSIKGPRAVQENLVPRLQALLAGKSVD
jgi:thiol-disulfide isomerase/thioredoxin